MSLTLNFCFFCFGIFVSFFILRIGINILKKHSLDKPNSRSLHKKPIPRGGGLSFIIPLLIYDLFLLCIGNFSSLVPLSLLCLPLIFISFLDDLFKVPSIIRYIVQVISSFLIIYFTNFQFSFTNSFIRIFAIITLIIIITGLTNFTNFMDGSDGLVAGCMFVLFITLNFKLNYAPNLIILLGSLLTFLFWNWPPAKVFMGDVGSNFLGIYFVANMLQLDNIEILGLVFIASPLYGDALITLLRRFISRQNIFQAHRQHLYQRLYLGGLSKQIICLCYIFSCTFLSLIYLKLNLIYEIVAVSFVLLIMFIIDDKYALSFKDSI